MNGVSTILLHFFLGISKLIEKLAANIRSQYQEFQSHSTQGAASRRSSNCFRHTQRTRTAQTNTRRTIFT